MDRREFIKATLVGGGMVALSGLDMSSRAAAAVSSTDFSVPHAILGRTNVEVSRFAIGCAPLQREHVKIEDIEKILHRAVELGINYLDVAPNYGTAEEKVGPALKEIRDKFFLVTKTEEPTYEGTWRLLKQSMKRLQTDHIDMVHLHNFGLEERFVDLDEVFGDKGAMGALREARKQGVIRFIGASGHLHPSRFHAALDTGEIDVLMNAVNFVVQHTYDFEHKVWSRAHLENIGLVAMKVLGGWTGPKGFRLPEESYEQAIRYALSIPGISCAVIGIDSMTELEVAAETVIMFKPLSQEEAHQLSLQGLELAGTADWQKAYGDPLT